MLPQISRRFPLMSIVIILILDVFPEELHWSVIPAASETVGFGETCTPRETKQLKIPSPHFISEKRKKVELKEFKDFSTIFKEHNNNYVTRNENIDEHHIRLSGYRKKARHKIESSRKIRQAGRRRKQFPNPDGHELHINPDSNIFQSSNNVRHMLTLTLLRPLVEEEAEITATTTPALEKSSDETTAKSTTTSKSDILMASKESISKTPESITNAPETHSSPLPNSNRQVITVFEDRNGGKEDGTSTAEAQVTSNAQESVTVNPKTDLSFSTHFDAITTTSVTPAKLVTSTLSQSLSHLTNQNHQDLDGLDIMSTPMSHVESKLDASISTVPTLLNSDISSEIASTTDLILVGTQTSIATDLTLLQSTEINPSMTDSTFQSTSAALTTFMNSKDSTTISIPSFATSLLIPTTEVAGEKSNDMGESTSLGYSSSDSKSPEGLPPTTDSNISIDQFSSSTLTADAFESPTSISSESCTTQQPLITSTSEPTMGTTQLQISTSITSISGTLSAKLSTSTFPTTTSIIMANTVSNYTNTDMVSSTSFGLTMRTSTTTKSVTTSTQDGGNNKQMLKTTMPVPLNMASPYFQPSTTFQTQSISQTSSQSSDIVTSTSMSLSSPEEMITQPSSTTPKYTSTDQKICNREQWLECDSNSLKCTCQTGMMYDSDLKKCVSLRGEECQGGGGEKFCIRNAECSSNTIGQVGRCDCSLGFLPGKDGDCLPGLGSVCSNSTNASSSLSSSCSVGMTCLKSENSWTCSCQDGWTEGKLGSYRCYLHYNSKCGDPSDSSESQQDQCNMFNFLNCSATVKECKCEDEVNQVYDEGKKACVAISGRKCMLKDDSKKEGRRLQCGNNAECKNAAKNSNNTGNEGDTMGTCECLGGHENDWRGICQPKNEASTLFVFLNKYSSFLLYFTLPLISRC